MKPFALQMQYGERWSWLSRQSFGSLDNAKARAQKLADENQQVVRVVTNTFSAESVELYRAKPSACLVRVS